MTHSFVRDYDALARSLAATGTRMHRMHAVVDAAWRGLSAGGVSWIGFYLDQPGEPDGRRLILGPCRDKPACSPIGLHGVCGQSLVERRVRIIDDVRELGERYIACDPRDRSEIVLPLFDASGECWGVLDVDSWQPSAFDERDADGFSRVLVAAGLTCDA